MSDLTAGKAGIDPRLRQRRIAVRRAAARRRLHVMVSAGSVLAVLLVAALVLASPLFDIDHQLVHGAQRTPRALVIDASRLDRHDALVTADLGAATRRIEALPWVESATIRRQFPGTIDITVTERIAAALVETTTGATFLVDDSGRRLGAPSSADARLIRMRIDGRLPAEGHRLRPAGRGALSLVAMARRQLVDHDVIVLVTGSSSALDVDGIRVLLGDVADRRQAFTGLKTMLERVDLTCAGTIDLRAAERPVLTRRAPCQ